VEAEAIGVEAVDEIAASTSVIAAVYHATARYAKNKIPKQCKQARNQVGTLGGLKSFLREVHIF